MRNKRHRNNFIKVDGLIEYGKERIFIVIKFILAIGKKSAKEKLFVMLSYRYSSFLGGYG